MSQMLLPRFILCVFLSTLRFGKYDTFVCSICDSLYFLFCVSLIIFWFVFPKLLCVIFANNGRSRK